MRLTSSRLKPVNFSLKTVHLLVFIKTCAFKHAIFIWKLWLYLP